MSMGEMGICTLLLLLHLCTVTQPQGGAPAFGRPVSMVIVMLPLCCIYIVPLYLLCCCCYTYRRPVCCSHAAGRQACRDGGRLRRSCFVGWGAFLAAVKDREAELGHGQTRWADCIPRQDTGRQKAQHVEAGRLEAVLGCGPQESSSGDRLLQRARRPLAHVAETALSGPSCLMDCRLLRPAETEADGAGPVAGWTGGGGGVYYPVPSPYTVATLGDETAGRRAGAGRGIYLLLLLFVVYLLCYCPAPAPCCAPFVVLLWLLLVRLTHLELLENTCGCGIARFPERKNGTCLGGLAGGVGWAC